MVAAQDREARRWELLALAGIVLLSAAFRIWQLGAWSFEGDEIYTLRDSVVLNPNNPRPLLYLLNHYLVLPFTPPTEISLRLLPVAFGILGIPIMYLVVRRTINGRAALFAALLVALSPLHIARAQYARYWTLIFFLTTCYPLAMYLAVHERRWRWLAVGIAAGIAATLAHPSASLLFGGVVLWLAVIAWREPRVRAVLDQRSVRLALILLALFGVGVVAARFVPLLSRWIATPQRALRGPALLMSYVDGLTAGVVITGLLGIAWLWLDGRRSLAVLLASCIAVPTAMLFGVSLVGAVPTAYLFATAPMYFIGAGAFLDRLAALPIAPPFRRLLVTSYVLIVLAAAVPLLISHYLDGGRPDFRAAAAFLRAELRPGDGVLTDEIPVLRHYLPDVPVDTLKRTLPDFTEKATHLAERAPDRSLWVVALTSKRGWFAAHKFGLGPLADQLYGRCRLRRVIGVARLDYRQNELQIFRCAASDS